MRRLWTAFGFTLLVAAVLMSSSPLAAKPSYFYGLNRGVDYTPGHPIRLAYSADSSVGALHVILYAITTDQAIAIYRRNIWRVEPSDVTGQVVKEFDSTDRLDSANAGPNDRVVDLGTPPIGFYAAVIRSGDTVVTQLINITTLGLIVEGSEGRHSVWCVDLRTFQHHDGPTQVWIADPKAGLERLADASGLAFFDDDVPAGSVFVARSADGSTSIETPEYAGWGFRASNDNLRAYIQTDRPVYRPSQHVYFRAILRRGYVGSYSVPRGDLQVRIEDQTHRVIYDERLPVDAFGSIRGEGDLPDDARLGNYSITIDDGPMTTFAVAAYKKPEYEISLSPTAQWFLGGTPAHFIFSSKYFFGRPVAGMHVHYAAAVSSQNRWLNASQNPKYPTPEPYRTLAPADTLTGKDGTVAIDIPSEHEPLFTQFVSINVEGRDESGRTVSTTSSIEIDPALFHLGITGLSGGGYVGDPISLTVASLDNATDDRDGAFAGTPIDLNIYGIAKEVSGNRKPFLRTHDSLRIDSDGQTSEFRFSPPREGRYDFVATAHDRLGNQVVETAQYEVSRPFVLSTPSPDPGPSVSLDRFTYKANDRPRVAVKLAEPDRDVLVSTFYDGLFNSQVLHVNSTSGETDVAIPTDARNFRVEAQLPTESGVNDSWAGAWVQPWPKGVSIYLRSDKTHYAPGDEAGFDFFAYDQYRRPVRAEIAIGVVDKAIYDVVDGDFDDPNDTFYPRDVRDEYSNVSWFLPNDISNILMSIPGVRTKPGVREPYQPQLTTDAYSTSRAYNPNDTSEIPLRSNLLDTAFWSATVLTDSNGYAHVRFPWPDNLTTWVAFATVAATDARFTSAQTEVLVTKDFLVRLELPRFLRKSDRSQVGAIVHGRADAPNVSLRLDQARLSPTLFDASLKLDDAQSASATWPISAGRDLGDVELSLRGSDGTRSDGLKLSLPVEAVGPAEHMRDAGSLPADDTTRLSLPPGYDAGRLDITFEPSELARLINSVHLLDIYPYYCTEQTMSSALPAIFVQRALRETGMNQPGSLKLNDVVRKAIARLSDLQHADGSWGWWEHDAAHPFMTAYAMYGLAEFRKAGYAVPSSLYDRGVVSLSNQMRGSNGDTLRYWGGAQAGSEWNTRAYMLFALADAAPRRVDRDALQATYAHAAGLNAYALAVLGLAYHELGDDEAARSLLAQLNARATSGGDLTYWAGPTWHYGWEDDPLETTAYALRLNAVLNPSAPIAHRIVNFLLAQQRGSWWYTTKDTAAAIYAISESIDPASNEFKPNETLRVRVGQRVVRELHITGPLLSAVQGSVVIPASELHDGTAVTFERSGSGSLYWSTDFERYAPSNSTRSRDSSTPLFARLFPSTPDLSVDRRYDVKHGGAWQIGDEVSVDVTVRARATVQYVAVEEPFPAGVEYQPDQGRVGWDWSGVQFFDDRAVFFATEVTPQHPLQLHYTLRVTTPGSYTAPPPVAYAMYGPPLRAVGISQHVEVIEP